MRHRICWADLAGSRIGIWGLGTEGRANLHQARSLGAEVVIVDDAPAADAGEPMLATAEGGLDALLACDVVVRTPGISRRRVEVGVLEATGVPVVGGLGLWLAGAPLDRVVCVTGSKGKSTTTSIAAHLATGLGTRAVAVGNLGLPPHAADAPIDAELWVVEVSSYQAATVAVSPPVVAVTSLSPDHLPWHGDEASYVADKLSLCTQSGARWTVAGDTPALRQRAGLLGPEVRWIGVPAGAWADPLGLVGTHTRIDAEIARTCLELAGVPGADDPDALTRAAGGYRPLPSRLEAVGTVDGVTFVDDGLSTNVGPTLAALDAFPGRRIALIAGGLDRDIDYAPLAAHLVARDAPTCVLTVYGTGPRIRSEVEAALGAADGAEVRVVPCADLEEATREGFAFARPDGVVLLSPAAASFDAFDDYVHRSRVFRAAVADVAAG